MHVNRWSLLLFFPLVTITWSLVNPPSIGLSALPASEGRVTRVHNHVQLLHARRAPQRASVNDVVDRETVVQTGKDSHAELTFSDETVVRLAANTAFSSKNGTHNLNLSAGAVLAARASQ